MAAKKRWTEWVRCAYCQRDSIRLRHERVTLGNGKVGAEVILSRDPCNTPGCIGPTLPPRKA